MKKVTVFTQFGFAPRREDEFEVQEDTTDAEIEEMAKEVAFENIEWYYEIDNN
jgi:hypothetical protein